MLWKLSNDLKIIQISSWCAILLLHITWSQPPLGQVHIIFQIFGTGTYYFPNIWDRYHFPTFWYRYNFWNINYHFSADQVSYLYLRSKHQPNRNPWRSPLHSPHRCFHHLHQVTLPLDDDHHHHPCFYHHNHQHQHQQEAKTLVWFSERRREWRGSFSSASSPGWNF